MQITIDSKKHGSKTVFVSPEDFNRIKGFKWMVVKATDNLYYAVTKIGYGSQRYNIYLHRLIMSFPDSIIDYITEMDWIIEDVICERLRHRRII